MLARACRRESAKVIARRSFPAHRYGAGDGDGATVLVVCGGVPEGEGLGVDDGATVLLVCGWLPEGEALASGITVAVGTGED